MVTGTNPFRKDSYVETASAILKEPPPALTQTGSGAPAFLERVLKKMLAKERGARTVSAKELLGDLERLRTESASSGARADSGSFSLAVLPFLNMNRDEEGEIFSEGLTEELINALAQIPDLRVASRSSAFRFKGAAQDIREVGERLEVDAVVEGSVRRSGGSGAHHSPAR